MRKAILLCSADVMRDFGPLFDAGLSVFGSFDSAAQPEGVVVLGIEGDALPEVCEPGLHPLREVTLELTRESYGHQRMVRVTAIKLTGRDVFDVAPRQHQRAA